MGVEIIKQPNGKYGLFSTMSDRIFALDCTAEELISFWGDVAKARAERDMREWLSGSFSCPDTISLKTAIKKHQMIPVGCPTKSASEQVIDIEVLKMKPKRRGGPRGRRHGPAKPIA